MTEAVRKLVKFAIADAKPNGGGVIAHFPTRPVLHIVPPER